MVDSASKKLYSPIVQALSANPAAYGTSQAHVGSLGPNTSCRPKDCELVYGAFVLPTLPSKDSSIHTEVVLPLRPKECRRKMEKPNESKLAKVQVREFACEQCGIVKHGASSKCPFVLWKKDFRTVPRIGHESLAEAHRRTMEFR